MPSLEEMWREGDGRATRPGWAEHDSLTCQSPLAAPADWRDTNHVPASAAKRLCAELVDRFSAGARARKDHERPLSRPGSAARPIQTSSGRPADPTAGRTATTQAVTLPSWPYHNPATRGTQDPDFPRRGPTDSVTAAQTKCCARRAIDWDFDDPARVMPLRVTEAQEHAIFAKNARHIRLRLIGPWGSTVPMPDDWAWTS
jgi:hypothetical protein